VPTDGAPRFGRPMVDIFLWLGDRLELSIPVVLMLGLAVLAMQHLRRRRRREPTPITQGDRQMVVMEKNRVRGDVTVSQTRR
jgi:hypothetical protein